MLVLFAQRDLPVYGMFVGIKRAEIMGRRRRTVRLQRLLEK